MNFDRLSNLIALIIVPLLGVIVLYVWTVRCGLIPEPKWFDQFKGPSYPIQK